MSMYDPGIYDIELNVSHHTVLNIKRKHPSNGKIYRQTQTKGYSSSIIHHLNDGTANTLFKRTPGGLPNIYKSMHCTLKVHLHYHFTNSFINGYQLIKYTKYIVRIVQLHVHYDNKPLFGKGEGGYFNKYFQFPP